MSHKNEHAGTLDLRGEGEIEVKPDIAFVQLAIVTEGKTAEEAVGKNAQKASNVIDRLTKLEIPRKDMKTTNLNLYPIYDTDAGSSVSTIVGYRAQNAIMVEAHVQLAGKVFDVGVAGGANESSGVSFAIKDERPYRQQALELAIKNARAEADAVCSAMGVTLKGPHTIQVTRGSGPIRLRSERLTAKAATPLLPGQLTISAEVQVVFDYHS